MKWARSFLLHPWINRFNLLYLLLGTAAFLAAPADVSVGWWVLGGEAAYLVVRGALDRSRLPAFQIRTLSLKERLRYVHLWETSRRVKRDLEANRHRVGAMAADPRQVDRLLRAVLELQIAARRIDRYVLSRRINYDAEIADAAARMATANGKEKEVLAGNLGVLQRRREAHRELTERRRTIEGRLRTLENAIELLGEVGVGLSQPDEAADQVKVILANVEDAETFISELNQAIAPIREKA